MSTQDKIAELKKEMNYWISLKEKLVQAHRKAQANKFSEVEISLSFKEYNEFETIRVPYIDNSLFRKLIIELIQSANLKIIFIREEIIKITLEN